jgi:hypothetical protein
LGVFVGATRSSLGKRCKQAARSVVVAGGHAAGLLVAGHCLVVVLHAGGILGPVPAAIIAGYEVGLISLAVVLPQNGWPGRIKAALTTGGVVGLLVVLFGLPFVGGVVGAVLCVAQFILPISANILAWALLTPLLLACAAAVVASVVELLTGRRSRDC